MKYKPLILITSILYKTIYFCLSLAKIFLSRVEFHPFLMISIVKICHSLIFPLSPPSPNPSLLEITAAATATALRKKRSGMDTGLRNTQRCDFWRGKLGGGAAPVAAQRQARGCMRERTRPAPSLDGDRPSC